MACRSPPRPSLSRCTSSSVTFLPAIADRPALDGHIRGHGKRTLVRLVRVGHDLHRHALLVGRDENEAHVRVPPQRLLGPDRGDDLPEFAGTGHSETTWFQGLSGGKTSRAARIASASGVSNITGLVIFGIGRRPRLAPGCCAAAKAPSPARTITAAKPYESQILSRHGMCSRRENAFSACCYSTTPPTPV